MPGKVTRIGRLIRTDRIDEARSELLALAQKSDATTRRAFAEEHGVDRSTLHRWCTALECSDALDDALLPAV